MPDQVRIFAPAKINWALEIRGKRPDGYHDLETIFQTLNWGDELACRRIRARECRITCDDPAVPMGEVNLIAKAWGLMAGEFGERVGGLAVRLTKRIPMGGGLGGGSSDAAATLKAIDCLFGLKLSLDRLEKLAARLGSDCPFFIRGGTAWGRGRGEKLKKVPNRLPPVHLVVVWPGFGSSTAEAFAKARKEHYSSGRRVAAAARAIENGSIAELQKKIHSIFSILVLQGRVEYKRVREDIMKERLLTPMISGSGSSMFAFAGNRRHAALAARRLRQHHPVAVAVTPRSSGVRIVRSKSG